MAENASATAWNVDAPEDGEYINRIPKEMRFLRGAVESVVKEEHSIVETGDVITSTKHKMGAARAYAGAYAGTGGAPSNNPGGNALSTVAETAQVATCEVGRIAIDTSLFNRLYGFVPDEDATAVWTGISAIPCGTAPGTVYMNSFPISGLRTAVIGSHAVPAAQFAGTTLATDADGQFYVHLSGTSFATADAVIELATGALHNAEGGFNNADVDGTNTLVYTKYFTGTLDADAQTDVAHGIADVDKILHVSVCVWNDSAAYLVQDFRGGASDVYTFEVSFNATNVVFAAVGATVQGEKYRIKIDYIL